MTYARKIVLHCPHGATPGLGALVEDFIRDGVAFVGVVGEDCERIEDLIDEIVVGDGTRDCFILTTSHADETLEEVMELARLISGDDDELEGEPQLVELVPEQVG